MAEDTQLQGGMHRREVLRRGAVVGGTLVWAAPAVQVLAPRAFAQAGSPIEEPPEEQALTGFSYAAFIVRCVNDAGVATDYRVKGELNDRTGAIEFETGKGLPDCSGFASFAAAYVAASGSGGLGTKFDVTTAKSGSVVTFVVVPRSGHSCTVVRTTPGGVSGVMKEAGNCSAQVAATATSISFNETLTDP